MAHIIHISDTHLGPTPGFKLFGRKTYPPVEALIEVINHLPFQPDLVIHTGDVVVDPDPEAYALAADLFSRLHMPVYFVTGNHDSTSLIKKQLPFGEKVDLLEDEAYLTYKIPLTDSCLYVLDARGSDDIQAQGSVSDSVFEAFSRDIKACDQPVAVFLHFPPISLGAPWLDRDMLIINGDRIHQLFVDLGKKLRGVFFGHVHRGMHILKDGVPYTSVGSTFCQFTAWPNDEKPWIEGFCPTHYNLITLSASQTLVKEQSFIEKNLEI